ncbi:exostosin family [Seminavis robusta]|uniref:Exostosin family n=1 Tax=Seminavis robusta TaxID=568900 RepID=A0A9N8H236_9STRA|nr:exostosin family [Seminavis robusta]|eukprot:Sro3_g002600.1 exostosin family (480) ;mRNA; f:204177-205616
MRLLEAPSSVIPEEVPEVPEAPEEHIPSDAESVQVPSTTTSMHTAMHSSIDRDELKLLEVPFYIYEELLLTNATVGKHNEKQKQYTLERWMEEREVKHTDDYWWVQAALKHRMRTLDPAKAKLFLVPTLVNEIYDQAIWVKLGLCDHDDRCNLKLLQHANDVLGKSPWFQRSKGRDHIVVASHYMTYNSARGFKHIAHCNVIGLEKYRWNHPDRLFLPNTYVGTACTDGQSNKTHDFTMIATIKPHFKDRQYICKALQKKKKKKRNAIELSVSTCGKGNQCPALAQAKMGFHVKGDSYGSNRLIDTILSGTVPIFTSQQQYHILPTWIDWEALSFFADPNQHRQHTFLQRLQQFATNTKRYEQKRKFVNDNRALLDWRNTPSIPFEHYMYAFARSIMPELQPQKQAPPQFSALWLEAVEDLRPIRRPTVFCDQSEIHSCRSCGGSQKTCHGQCQWCAKGVVGEPSTEGTCANFYEETCA